MIWYQREKSFAEFYYDISGLQSKIESIPQAVRSISKITADITEYDQLRRWQYIASYLNGYYWESKMNEGKNGFVDSDKIGDL